MTTNLTTTSYLVLGLIARMGRATPYDLKRAVFHTIEYFWAFPHSQLYAEPERLQKAGYLQETRERSGRRRRSFSITEKGREALDLWLKEPTTEPVEIRDLGLLKLYFGELVSAAEVSALAQQQTALHRERLDEYEARCAARQQPDVALAYPLAMLEMGVLFERAAIAFWTTIAAEPPTVGDRLQPQFDVESRPAQAVRQTQKTRSRKAQSVLRVEDESKKNSTSAAQTANDSVAEAMKKTVAAVDTRQSTHEDLPDHLL